MGLVVEIWDEVEWLLDTKLNESINILTSMIIKMFVVPFPVFRTHMQHCCFDLSYCFRKIAFFKSMDTGVFISACANTASTVTAHKQTGFKSELEDINCITAESKTPALNLSCNIPS